MGEILTEQSISRLVTDPKGFSVGDVPPGLLSGSARPLGTHRRRAPRRYATLASVALVSGVAFLACWSVDQTYLGPALLLAVVLSGRMPRPGLVDVLAVLFGAWVVASLGWTVDTSATRSAVYLYGTCVLLLIAVRHVVTTTRDLLAVGGAFLAGCLLRAVELIREPSLTGPTGRAGAFDLTIRYGIEGFNINLTAYTMVAGILLALLMGAVGGLPRAARVVLYASVPLLGYAVLLSGTRGALAALVLGAAYLLCSRAAPRTCWRVAAFVVPAALILIPLGMGEATLLRLDGLVADRATGDLAGRMLVWPEAVAVWWQSPLAGIGAGAFTAVSSWGIGAHSLLLTLGADLGLIGVLCYAAVLTAAVRPVGNASRPGARLAGLFLVTFLPIWLTGHWESAMAAWLPLALVSLVPALTANPTGAGGRHRRADRSGPDAVPPRLGGRRSEVPLAGPAHPAPQVGVLAQHAL
ncbi:O-antigen ligase family protein [Micromonospora sp. NPDC049048]|uniref:O-antigen ligase family protein n=1 Tax=Micromonospora sp. NPDC049048 TaxID=3364263 RepID=UPI00371FA4C1